MLTQKSCAVLSQQRTFFLDNLLISLIRREPFHKCVIGLFFLQFLVHPADAQNLTKTADEAYEHANFGEAIDLYEKAFKKKQTTHVTERLASSNRLVKNYKKAENWYALLLRIPGSSFHNILYYAQALQHNYKYAEAKEQYRRYVDLNSQVSSDQRNKWFANCDSAQRWISMPVDIRLKNESVINSPKSDWGAVPYNGGLIFSSDRKAISSRGLYEYKKESGQISKFSFSANADDQISSPSFSGDEKEMYFSMQKNKKHGGAYVQIYSSHKDEEGKWSAPEPFKYNNPAEYSVGDPFLSKDGNVLYFVSNSLVGKGGTDIYYCKKAKDGSWDIPVNLSSVNTDGNERTPYLDEAGNFYFSSDGHTGMGGLDIFIAKKSGDGFSEIRNIGYPLNSPQDDFSYCVTSDGKGYFSSDRLEGAGKDEIYSFDINLKK